MAPAPVNVPAPAGQWAKRKPQSAWSSGTSANQPAQDKSKSSDVPAENATSIQTNAASVPASTSSSPSATASTSSSAVQPALSEATSTTDVSSTATSGSSESSTSTTPAKPKTKFKLNPNAREFTLDTPSTSQSISQQPQMMQQFSQQQQQQHLQQQQFIQQQQQLLQQQQYMYQMFQQQQIQGTPPMQPTQQFASQAVPILSPQLSSMPPNFNPGMINPIMNQGPSPIMRMNPISPLYIGNNVPQLSMNMPMLPPSQFNANGSTLVQPAFSPQFGPTSVPANGNNRAMQGMHPMQFMNNQPLQNGHPNAFIPNPQGNSNTRRSGGAFNTEINETAVNPSPKQT